jgi:recombinational DNA repair ATPase RecF
MPIVSIVLKNFRSYSAETVDLLNNRMNVILGRNGEGKSNLLRCKIYIYSAILFVLSDKIQFNQTERNNLMHVYHSISIERCD